MSTSKPAGAQPIDREHLERATLGDAALQREVLTMFQTQLAEAKSRLAKADASERSRIAHAIKGAASGLGAFEIADCAARMERRPGEARLVDEFGLLASRLDEAIRPLTA